MREYAETYLWEVHDADTPYVLVPHGYAEFRQWQVLHIRIRNLYAPELSTPEGKELTAIIRERLLTRWTRCRLTTFGRTFDRWVGDLWLPSGFLYAEDCKLLMAQLGIDEGGVMAARKAEEGV